MAISTKASKPRKPIRLNTKAAKARRAAYAKKKMDAAWLKKMQKYRKAYYQRNKTSLKKKRKATYAARKEEFLKKARAKRRDAMSAASGTKKVAKKTAAKKTAAKKTAAKKTAAKTAKKKAK